MTRPQGAEVPPIIPQDGQLSPKPAGSLAGGANCPLRLGIEENGFGNEPDVGVGRCEQEIELQIFRFGVKRGGEFGEEFSTNCHSRAAQGNGPAHPRASDVVDLLHEELRPTGKPARRGLGERSDQCLGRIDSLSDRLPQTGQASGNEAAVGIENDHRGLGLPGRAIGLQPPLQHRSLSVGPGEALDDRGTGLPGTDRGQIFTPVRYDPELTAGPLLEEGTQRRDGRPNRRGLIARGNQQQPPGRGERGGRSPPGSTHKPDDNQDKPQQAVQDSGKG